MARAAIYSNMSKAVDSVPHPHHKPRVSSLGIAGPFLSGISPYLTHESQVVFTGDTISNAKSGTNGFTQCTALGSLLFTTH